MSKYPHPFDHRAFPEVKPYIPPRGKPPLLTRKAKVTHQSTVALKPPSPGRALAKQVYLQKQGDPTRRSQSFQNVNMGHNKAIAANKHFNFLPSVDDVEMRWEVTDADRASKVRWELLCNAAPDHPIWSKEYSGDTAAYLLTAGESINFNEVQIDDAEHYPGGCPNVAFAPYQLKMIITDRDTGCVSTAWTYFDVLVDRIEINWGPEALIPAGDIAGVDNVFKTQTRADEKALLRKLRKDGDPGGPVTAVGGGDHKLPLPSNTAAYLDYYEWYSFRDFAFLRHLWRWGDGPRIPLLAKIFLKDIDGGSVHSADAARALGPARFLWDWQDKPEGVRNNEETGSHATAGAFVIDAMKYQQNLPAANDPPDSLNCHEKRGGKRGSTTRRIFPEQDGAGAFPFVVEACETRKWAVLSQAQSDGQYACYTGVIFQPSRVAKDSYKVSVLLANELTQDKTRTVLDAAVKLSSVLQHNQDLPLAQSGWLEVWRLVKARYVRKSTAYKHMDLTVIDQMYAPVGLVIDWTEELWTKAQHDRLLAEAIAHVAYCSSLPLQRGQRHPKALNGRHTKIEDLKRFNCLDWFDHWYGCKAGQTRTDPSELCFTFPDKEIVVRPILAQVVKDYINKNRRINSVRRSWTSYRAKTAIAALSEEEALERFFKNKLKKKTRDKLMLQVKAEYGQTQWKQFDEDDALKWAEAHFLYGYGPIQLCLEMHQRKIMEDAFEGITFFHFINMWETVGHDGNTKARSFALGGVAKVDSNADLGIRSGFFVWDHPDDGRRGASRGETMMNGNETAAHEFGHNLHLPHWTPPGGDLEQAMHDQNDARCVMDYHHVDRHLCGSCRLRLRGWAFFKDADFGVDGYSNTTPQQDGMDPPLPPHRPVYNVQYPGMTR